MKDARVEQLMVRELRTIDGMASVEEALRVMKRHELSSLVVARRSVDDEVGLLEVATVAAEVLARNRAPTRVQVYEVMTKPVVAVSATMRARYALRLLCDLGLSRTVVVNDARDPIGMVTLRDLALADVRAEEEEPTQSSVPRA